MMVAARSLRADARRNRDAVLDAASELFAERGGAVQMDEIAERAGLGVGTVYRHFADKQTLLAAIIGRRFEAMTGIARTADEISDAGAAFAALLYGYLEAAQADAAFRLAVLGPERPDWESITAEKARFATVGRRIVRRAVKAGALRADFSFDDFVRLTRGVMVNMDGDWRRHVALALEGVEPRPR